MENERVGKDDKRSKFQGIWDAKSEEDKQEFAFGLYTSDAGSVKKVTELKAEVDRYKAMAESGDLTQERASLAAAKTLIEIQSRLIEKAVKHEIDPAVAVEFAKSSDPDGLFDNVVKEIDNGILKGVNEKLGTSAPESSTPQGVGIDLSTLSAAEISRLPQDVVQKYMNDKILGG